MLTYEALIEQAQLRGMPTSKMRGILREYLQILILKEMYRTDSGRKLYFTGGTYLRLAHHVKRFSEDLDFNTDRITQKEFERLTHKVSTELKRVGVESQTTFAHWGNIYVSKLLFPEVEKAYDVVSPYSKKKGILIKIEVNKPRWVIKKEAHVVSGFGELYPCLCTEKGSLFADKIDALLKKDRARHLYDIIFMLTQQFPINVKVLGTFGIKADPQSVITDHVARLSKAALKKQAEALRPFLFEESDADLIINASTLIPSLLRQYQPSS